MEVHYCSQHLSLPCMLKAYEPSSSLYLPTLATCPMLSCQYDPTDMTNLPCHMWATAHFFSPSSMPIAPDTSSTILTTAFSRSLSSAYTFRSSTNIMWVVGPTWWLTCKPLVTFSVSVLGPHTGRRASGRANHCGRASFWVIFCPYAQFSDPLGINFLTNS